MSTAPQHDGAAGAPIASGPDETIISGFPAEVTRLCQDASAEIEAAVEPLCLTAGGKPFYAIVAVAGTHGWIVHDGNRVATRGLKPPLLLVTPDSHQNHQWEAVQRAMNARRHVDEPIDESLATEVERQTRLEKARRIARATVDLQDAAALDADADLSDDWQPMSVAEAHARFESLVGQEWVESIAPKGGKGTVYGPSMSAKTVFLNYVALAGANATVDESSTVFGKTIYEPFGTLFVTLEDAHNQHARLDAIARQHGWSTDGVLVMAPEDPPHISDPHSLARLVSAARQAQARLREDHDLPLGQIVIDTGKYLVAGKDTNSTESHSLVTSLMAKLSSVAEGAYVAVVTHTPLTDDDRPVGSHDQTASRDHAVAIKNVHGTRQVTLAKHKFAPVPAPIGMFKVESVTTPFSPHSMPGLEEVGSAAAGFVAGAAKALAEAESRADEATGLLDYLSRHRDADGWVDQSQVQANQSGDGLGKNKAKRAKDLLDSLDAPDNPIIQVDSVVSGRAVRRRWRMRPDLTVEQASARVREALGLDE